MDAVRFDQLADIDIDIEICTHRSVLFFIQASILV